MELHWEGSAPTACVAGLLVVTLITQTFLIALIVLFALIALIPGLP